MGELSATDGRIAKLSALKKALTKAATLDEVLDIREAATAIRAWAKAAGESREIQNAAAEARLRAECKVGELLSGMDGIGMGKKCDKLSHLGIERHQSSRWQLAAQLPEQHRDQFFAACTESGRDITQAALLRLAKLHVHGEPEPAEKYQSERADLGEAVAKARTAVSELQDVFGDDRIDVLIQILRDEITAMEERHDGND